MERQTSEHQELASTGAGQRPGAVPEKGSVRDIEKRFDKLKSSIQSRLQRIHEGEVATQKQDMLLQKRMEGLYDREQQVTERETAVLQREQQLHAEHSKLSQLQSELQQQYVCLMTSLPLLQERLHSARKSLPEYAAAAESLDNSHANLAVSSHQLLRQPAAANQSDEVAFQEANICQSQHSKGIPDVHRSSPEARNGSSQPDVVAQQNTPDLHEVQAQPQQPSSSLLQHDSKQAAQAAATPVAHVAQHAASISAALPQQSTASAQEASAHGLCEPNAVPPWEARGAPDASNAQPVQVAKRKREPSNKSGSKKTLSKHQSQQLPTTIPVAEGSPAGMQAPAPTATAPAVSTSAPLSTVDPAGMSSIPNGTPPKFKVAVPDSRPAAQRSAGMQPHPAPVRTRSDAAGGHSSPKASANGESLGSPRASAEALAALKGGNELGSPTSSSRGRGGLFGRNRRGRGRSQLSRPGDQSLAGDLDEAVQALKATTGGTDSPRNADSNPQHASGTLTDDDLKPAFMRRLTSDKLQPDGTVTIEEAQLMGALQARKGGELDINPRPVSRRRLDPAATARKAAATAVLKSEVPDLLDLLQQKGLADEVDMLDPASSNSEEEQQQASSVYDKMHAILGRVCEGKAGSSWQGRGLNAGKMAGVDKEDGKHEYCLLALEHLVERAQAYSSGCEPVRWGWCRELTSFVFIFESANRIVVEKPNYGHATYFFDLEEPLPVAEQVKRLVAVLSVPGVSRRKLLEGTSLDPGPDVTLQERKQLEAAGWTPGTTVRSLLNFSGDRIFHQSADTMTGQKVTQLYTPDYKEKIAKVLSEGASGGRIIKAAATQCNPG